LLGLILVAIILPLSVPVFITLAIKHRLHPWWSSKSPVRAPRCRRRDSAERVSHVAKALSAASGGYSWSPKVGPIFGGR